MALKGETGGCLCGEVRYRLEGELVWAGYCHCESCRRFTGSVVTNWLGVHDDCVVFTAGEPAYYTNGVTSRGFCRDCGSSLTCVVDRFPGYFQLHVGSLDNPLVAAPLAHVHYGEKIDWFEVSDDLPRFNASAADAGDWKT